MTRRLAEAHGTRGWGEGVSSTSRSVNHGFGRGNNVVLRALEARERPPEKVMLLNPDARLDNEAADVAGRVPRQRTRRSVRRAARSICRTASGCRRRSGSPRC
jgi:hypothetical protein